jgi:hypothetical protein
MFCVKGIVRNCSTVKEELSDKIWTVKNWSTKNE